jgi:cytochrome c
MRLIDTRWCCCAVFILGALGLASAEAQLRGHGGPVRALAVSADGITALSGSFDTSAIRWSLQRNAAEQVLRFHDGAVNAVAILKDGRDVTAGEDARIGIWIQGSQKPDLVLEGHNGPIAALAVSVDETMLASASWDRIVRLWPLAGGPPRVLEGHRQSVNGVAFAPDNNALVSAGYDSTVRIWPLKQSGPPRVATLPTPLNAVAVMPDGEIVAAGADGKVYFLSSTGEERGAVDASATPIVALATTDDGGRVAVVSVGGPVAIIDRLVRKVARTLAGPGLPAWSAAFLPDGRTLLTGGADGMIRRWDSETGQAIDPFSAGGPEDPLAGYADDPGAVVFRACVACHTLKPDEGNRAGPTLHGIFGRRIASLPGYNFSDVLKHLDIVWTPETVAKLFEIGPASFTPGTKMPDQRIGAPGDRTALVEFLERATR